MAVTYVNTPFKPKVEPIKLLMDLIEVGVFEYSSGSGTKITVEERLLSIENFLLKFTKTFSQIFENSSDELSDICEAHHFTTTQLNEVMIVMGVKEKYVIPDNFYKPTLCGGFCCSAKNQVQELDNKKRDQEEYQSNLEQMLVQVKGLIMIASKECVQNTVFQSFLD